MTAIELAGSDDYLALLRGVLTDPAADVSRLVLADYLEENGQEERAGQIRWACEYAGGLGWSPVTHCICLGNDVFPCLSCGVPAWLYATTRPSPRTFYEPRMGTSRGFVALIRLTQPDFLTHAAAIFAAHPVTRVILAGVAPARVVRTGAARHVYDRVVSTDSSRYAFDRVGLLAEEPNDFTHYGHEFPTWPLVDRRIRRRECDGTVASRQNYDYYSMTEASAALSYDCVCYGRELSGLPPIPAPPAPPCDNRGT